MPQAPHGSLIVFLHEIDSRELVPAFRVIRRDLHQRGQQLKGKVKIFGVYRNGSSLHQKVGGVAAGLPPDPLDGFRDKLCRLFIGSLPQLLVKGGERGCLVLAGDALLFARCVLRGWGVLRLQPLFLDGGGRLSDAKHCRCKGSGKT